MRYDLHSDEYRSFFNFWKNSFTSVAVSMRRIFMIFLCFYFYNCILQSIGRCIKDSQEIFEDMNLHVEVKLFLKNKLAGYIKILQVV